MVEPILKPVHLPDSYSHRVGRRDEVYIAGVTDANFCSASHIAGSLFLDRIVEQKPVKLWKPTLVNPFRNVTKTEEVKECEFSGISMLLTWESFERFYKELNGELLSKHSARMDFEDTRLFFEKVYNYYEGFCNSLKEARQEVH